MSGSLQNYWDERYDAGGTSGPGSIGALQNWKHQTISAYIDPFTSVIDIGCGDLSFWGNRLPATYTGIDFSTVVIAHNLIRFPDRQWICGPASEKHPISAQAVICFDVLFHIMDENEFRQVLTSICSYSEQWIFIYTWYTNPIPTLRWQIRLKHLRNFRLQALIESFRDLTNDQVYERFRNLQEYLPIFDDAGFDLYQFIPYDQIGGMYIFRRR
jgi:2-polyprenyl-3-methyl-5-hydroxy-6-metoxy-1,4-benzoquinol methylase